MPRYLLSHREVFFVFILVLGYLKMLIIPKLAGLGFWVFDLTVYVILPLMYFKVFNNISQYIWLGRTPRPVQTWGEIVFFFLMSGLIFLVFLGFAKIAMKIIVVRKLIELVEPSYRYFQFIPSGGLLKYVVIVYFAVTAAVVEELVFRGMLYHIIKERIPQALRLFVLISAVFFSSAHVGQGSLKLVAAFFLGIALSIIYLWTKDLRYAIVIHALFDVYAESTNQ